MAVYEILPADQNIRSMIARGARAAEIETYAREERGMRLLREKGLELVGQGVTTPEEMLRCCYGF